MNSRKDLPPSPEGWYLRVQVYGMFSSLDSRMVRMSELKADGTGEYEIDLQLPEFADAYHIEL